MTRPLLSSSWYRIRGLKPRLRGNVRMHRHRYRGAVWHVAEDRASGKYHRFNPASYRVIGLLDGRRDMRQVWDLLTAEMRDDTPSQDDIAALLGQLHAADLIQCDVTPDVAEVFERWRKQERRKWFGRFANPVALRFPLIDPDAFVSALVRRLPWLWGWIGAAIWLAVVVPAATLVPTHWGELTQNFEERLLAADSLIVLALVFPLVKIVHEFGHAIACRIRGGEVHEMGVMLLVFYPVPYVDVSSSAVFASKWQRALVGAAGMLAELFVAALAFYAWVALEPGFARSMAYSVVVLASVTTFFYNAKPLLRNDGYYILADVLEIPNLGARAVRYWQYLAERWLLGVKGAEPAAATAGERRWFIAYAPLSFAYRLFVTFSIALFVAQQYFLIGVVLALWAVASGVGLPLWKLLRGLASGPQFADRRPRIGIVFALGGAIVAAVLFALPLPYSTITEGVLWLPEKAIVRADSAGFVSRVVAASGAPVTPGQAVVERYDPALAARRDVQAAKLEEVRAQYDAAWGTSQSHAQQLEEEIRREEAALARLEDEAARLTVRSGAEGRLVIADEASLVGRYVQRGDVVGHVRTGDVPLVRVVVTQAEVDPIRLQNRRIDVRMPQALDKSWPAALARIVPAAARQLPSAVLGQQGGGQVALDPRDQKGMRSLESLFEFELELPREAPHAFLGSRVHVRFEHPPEPIGFRTLRGLRRLFLSVFHV